MADFFQVVGVLAAIAAGIGYIGAHIWALKKLFDLEQDVDINEKSRRKQRDWDSETHREFSERIRELEAGAANVKR